jgi:hypothetical protein
MYGPDRDPPVARVPFSALLVSLFLLVPLPARALVMLSENAASGPIHAESCNSSTGGLCTSIVCAANCDGLADNRLEAGIHQCAFGFPFGTRYVQDYIQTDLEVAPAAGTAGDVVAAQFSYDIWWKGTWCLLGDLSVIKVGEVELFLDVLERGTSNLVYREQVHSLSAQTDFGFFDGLAGGGAGLDEGGRKSSFTVLLQRGKQYTVRLTLNARTELGVTTAYIGLDYDGGDHGAGWNDLHVTVGQDARGVVAGLQSQIDSLRTRFEHHGHIYLTGRGVGQNNTEAKTSEPIYFEDVTTPPDFLADPGQRDPLPTRSSLEEAAPNPVLGVGTIGYELPAASQVTIRLYNVQGQVVRTLVDGLRSAGRHEVPLDASGLAGGVYFYSLRTPQYYETRKIVISR